MEIATANRRKKYHFDKMKRRELNAQEKREKKLKWLRKLYRDAKNAEILAEHETLQNQKLEDLYNNPFDEERFLNYSEVSASTSTMRGSPAFVCCRTSSRKRLTT